MTMTDTTSGGLDTQGMLDAALALPEQVAAAVEWARGLDDLPDREEIEQVVVLGMGGSGIAGDVLMAAAGPYLPLPVLVFRSYHVPAFVDEGTLVFAISFSGDTEETVEAVTAAALQGARVVAVTRGGELGHLAESWGVPVVGVPENGRQLLDRRGHRAAQDPARPAGEARQHRRPAGPPHRADHAPDPRRWRTGRGGGPAMEDRRQRERQVPRLLEHPVRALPQRGVGLGPAR